MSFKRMWCLIVAIILMVGIFGACVGVKADNAVDLKELEKAEIGVVTGSIYANVVKKEFPDAKILSFATPSDVIMALEQGKVKAYVEDNALYSPIRWENKNVTAIETDFVTSDIAFAFNKKINPRIIGEVNEFIDLVSSDGRLDKLKEKWFGENEPGEHPDYKTLPATNGVIKVATDVSIKPMSYKKNNRISGYEIELLTLFAREYGYALDFKEVSFDATVAGLSAGKYDMSASCLAITEERKESILFSKPHYTTNPIVIVKGKQDPSKKLSDFEEGTLGVVTGSLYDGYTRKIFPDARILYYQTFADLFQCVQQGKIDGFMADEPNYNSVKRKSPFLTATTIPELNVEIGFGFQKGDEGEKLKEEMDSFINELRSDGRIDALIEKWYGEEEPQQTLDMPVLSDNKTKISVAFDTSRKPFVYILNNKFAGFEAEVLYMFCEKYGYNPVFSDVPFASGIAGLAGGKFDIVAGGLYMTDERKQSVNFSVPYMFADVVMVSYDESENAPSLFENIGESFKKTFIREDRWKLIAEGIAVTLIISILSTLFGTLLGFLLYMMSKSSNKALSSVTNGIGRVYSRIVAGTPVVVILMILFYIVFADFKNLSGVIIAILGFTFTFGAFVYDHMKVSTDSVDYGQTEAAYALGYSKNKTFFKIIFPQAMTIFLPSYCAEVVSLIKATAVVGYIAVNDLTRMGDIIRSNTYEAFFPLIATAVIYFIITWIIASLLNLVKLKFQPKRRSDRKILKGVVK